VAAVAVVTVEAVEAGAVAVGAAVGAVSAEAVTRAVSAEAVTGAVSAEAVTGAVSAEAVTVGEATAGAAAVARVRVFKVRGGPDIPVVSTERAARVCITGPEQGKVPHPGKQGIMPSLNQALTPLHGNQNPPFWGWRGRLVLGKLVAIKAGVFPCIHMLARRQGTRTNI